MNEKIDNRDYEQLDVSIALAQHTVYKRYLTELQNYPVVNPSPVIMDENAKECARFLKLQKLSCEKGEDMFQKLSTVYHASMLLGCSLIVMLDVESKNAPTNIYIGVRNNGINGVESFDPDKTLENWLNGEKLSPVNTTELVSNINEIKQPEAGDVAEKLTAEEKEKIKEETGWSDEIIDNIKNLKQYEILKNAELIEVEIDGKKCLIKKNIDLDYTDEDGISNRDRISRGLAPIDSKTEKPLELHHLGQKADSPLVELTEEEHRTGEYEEGKKNQSLWHDNTKETEVHGEGNNWDQERKAHWKERAEMMRGE